MQKRTLPVFVLFALCSPIASFADDKPDSDKKKGTVVGQLTAKGPNWIEVKADGEEKGRRYVPHWRGGAPDKGGGPDKEMVKVINDLKVGSRIRVEWEFEERARVIKVEVLKAAGSEASKPEKKDDAKEPDKKGKAIGTLTAKDKNWIELKADGEEKARRYVLHFGGTKELNDAIKDTPTGSRVEIEWLFHERLRVIKMDVLKKAASNP